MTGASNPCPGTPHSNPRVSGKGGMKREDKPCKPLKCIESTLKAVLSRHLEWLRLEQAARDPVYLAAALPLAILDAARAALGVINSGARKHGGNGVESSGCAGLKLAGNHFMCLKRLKREGLTPHRFVEETIKDILGGEPGLLEWAGAALARLEVRLEPPRRRGKNSGELSRIGKFRVRLRVATGNGVVDSTLEGEALGSGLDPDGVAETSAIAGLAGQASRRARAAGSAVVDLKRGRRRPPIAGLKRAVLAVKMDPPPSRSQGGVSEANSELLEATPHYIINVGAGG